MSTVKLYYVGILIFGASLACQNNDIFAFGLMLGIGVLVHAIVQACEV